MTTWVDAPAYMKSSGCIDLQRVGWGQFRAVWMAGFDQEPIVPWNLEPLCAPSQFLYCRILSLPKAGTSQHREALAFAALCLRLAQASSRSATYG